MNDLMKFTAVLFLEGQEIERRELTEASEVLFSGVCPLYIGPSNHLAGLILDVSKEETSNGVLWTVTGFGQIPDMQERYAQPTKIVPFIDIQRTRGKEVLQIELLHAHLGIADPEEENFITWSSINV